MREKIVKALCSARRLHFAINFVQDPSTKFWEGTKTLRISPERAERGFGNGSLLGVRIGPSYKGCPYCENKAFFLCNNCQTLNCGGAARKEKQQVYVRCVHCGASGYLEGLVEKLTGYSDV